MANTHSTLSSLFTAIANAIRSKTGGTGAIVADQFPSAISGIQVAEVMNYSLSKYQESMTVKVPNAFGGTSGTISVNGVFNVDDQSWDTTCIFYIENNEVIASFMPEVADYDGETVTVSISTSYITITLPFDARYLNYCALTIVREA